MKNLSNITKPLTLAMAAVCVCTMLASCGKTQTETPSTEEPKPTYSEWINGTYSKWVNTNPFLDENKNFTISPASNLEAEYVKNCVKHAVSVTVSEKITDINIIVAAKYPTIEKYIVDENNNRYTAVDGVIFTKDLKTLVLFPTGRGGEYKIPDGVEIIGKRAFAKCKLEKVEIPSSVKTIEEEAFADADIEEEIFIPDEVETVGERAFAISSGIVSIPADFKWDNYVWDSCIFKVVYVGGIDMRYDGGVFESGQRVDPYLGIIYRGTRAQWNKLEISINTSEKQVRCSDEKAR